MKKIILVMMIMLSVLTFWGCSSKQQSTAKGQEIKAITSEEAKQKAVVYLNNKYNAEHIVSYINIENLSPFQANNHFKGTAYRVNDASKSFEVYITEDGSEVRDNYFVFGLTAKVNNIFNNISQSIWDQIDCSVRIGITFSHGEWDEMTDLKEFVDKENPIIYATMYINPSEYNEAEEINNIVNFINQLNKQKLYGRLDISFLSTEDFSKALEEVKVLCTHEQRIESDLIYKSVLIEFNQENVPAYETVRNAFRSE